MSCCFASVIELACKQPANNDRDWLEESAKQLFLGTWLFFTPQLERYLIVSFFRKLQRVLSIFFSAVAADIHLHLAESYSETKKLVHTPSVSTPFLLAECKPHSICMKEFTLHTSSTSAVRPIKSLSLSWKMETWMFVLQTDC